VFFSPMYYKVLLAIENMPTCVWSWESTQAIIGSSFLTFNMLLGTNSKVDKSAILITARAVHLHVIPTEVGCIVPKPAEPSTVGVVPLFLHEDVIIHAK
jgi:hypothetical protein